MTRPTAQEWWMAAVLSPVVLAALVWWDVGTWRILDIIMGM